MTRLIYILLALALLPLQACRSHTTESVSANQAVKTGLPKAVIYKVDSRFADKVPVLMDAGKTRLISFPAPTDVSAGTSPIELIENYYLDRQGVGANSMFLEWTRDEYAAKDRVPSVAEIRQALIPLSYVIVIAELPMTTWDAASDTATVNNLIRDGLKGCRIVKGRPIQIGAPRQVVGTQL